MAAFSGLKVFSATMFTDRAVLGEKVTAWIQANPAKKIVDTTVCQSSDDSHHCITVIIWFHEATAPVLGDTQARRLTFKDKP